ncbi:antitermination protein, partial [Aeromonas caviae]
MTALGMVQKHNGAGMALVMARYCKDLGDAKKALLAVQAECAKIAPRYVGANKERGHGMALRRVAEL